MKTKQENKIDQAKNQLIKGLDYLAEALKSATQPEKIEAAKAFIKKHKTVLMGVLAVFLLYVACSDSNASIPKDVPKEAAKAAGKFSPTAEGARELVKIFAAPGADFWAFTEMVRPVKADFEAYFTKDVAEKLYEAYDTEIWNGKYAGQGLHRQPAQNYVVLHFSNTTIQKKGKSGGFRSDLSQVAKYIKDDFPYCEFELVIQGKRKGTFYNNMAYVNGRWVIFPGLWGVLRKIGEDI